MPDLTLDEFRDMPKEKLDQLLREEIGILSFSGLKKSSHIQDEGVLTRLLRQLRMCSQRLLRIV